jgi:hypothetical protein
MPSSRVFGRATIGQASLLFPCCFRVEFTTDFMGSHSLCCAAAVVDDGSSIEWV